MNLVAFTVQVGMGIAGSVLCRIEKTESLRDCHRLIWIASSSVGRLSMFLISLRNFPYIPAGSSFIDDSALPFPLLQDTDRNMAADAATNPAKRDLDFEYDFVSIILQFQTKNDTKLYNICHKTRCKTIF